MRTVTRAAPVLLAAVLLAGCASKPAAPGSGALRAPAPGLSASGSAGAGAAPKAPAATPPVSPPAVARAASDADRLLDAFTPPPGAVRLPKVPAALGQLDWPVGVPATPNLIRAQRYWQVTGDAVAVLAAIKAAPPAGATVQGTASGGVTGRMPATQSVTFAWAPDGQLHDRQLTVSTAQLGANTVIRLDALITWTNPKPVSATIGPNARIAVVSLIPRTGPVTMNRAIDPIEPVTISDPTLVAKMAAIINAAPPELPGMRGCPMMRPTATGMTIRFLAGPAGPTVDIVFLNTNGCQTITVTPTGAKPTTLEGGPQQIDQIIDLLGLHWPKQS